MGTETERRTLVHRHFHDWGEPTEPHIEGTMPESRLHWYWHAHQHLPEHVDTSHIDHPDVAVAIDAELRLEIDRQMTEFARTMNAPGTSG